jgi:haloalkane dehalogenase
MRPFHHRGLGELWLAGMTKPLFRSLMTLQGIGDRDSISKTELDAYLELMRGQDRGRAFLKIMRSTEPTPEKQALYRTAGLIKIESVPAKHFLQEDQAPAIADYVVALATRGDVVPR